MRFVACALLVLVIGCTSRPVEPTRSSRHTIDTIYQRRVSMMQPELDSLCNAIRERDYQYTVDSLLKERKAEMNILVE